MINESLEMAAEPQVDRGYDVSPVKSEYRPKKWEMLKEYEINIRFLSIGCVVSVGCKQIPFRDVNEAMDELNKYVNNPYEEEKKWRKLFDSED